MPLQIGLNSAGKSGWDSVYDAVRCTAREDVAICRNAAGKKIRIGEGGSGAVYKALMHGCDEVAVKLVKTHGATRSEEVQFHKEVCLAWPNPTETWCCHHCLASSAAKTAI